MGQCGHALHADETPIKVLRADKDRKTHRAYLWAYAPAIHEGLNAVIYDCTPSRAGAHARRKFYELHVANKSEIAAQALASFKVLYAIEAEAKDLDYSLKLWATLTRYLEDGYVPIDNNHIEQQIRPLALGRKNWLFAGSLRAGQRAAAIMTLIQSAKLNGHDPLAYLSDILKWLPTQPNHRIHELLPHHWQPTEQ